MHGFAKTNHVFPLKGTDGATKETLGVACALSGLPMKEKTWAIVTDDKINGFLIIHHA